MCFISNLAMVEARSGWLRLQEHLEEHSIEYTIPPLVGIFDQLFFIEARLNVAR